MKQGNTIILPASDHSKVKGWPRVFLDKYGKARITIGYSNNPQEGYIKVGESISYFDVSMLDVIAATVADASSRIKGE